MPSWGNKIPMLSNFDPYAGPKLRACVSSRRDWFTELLLTKDA